MGNTVEAYLINDRGLSFVTPGNSFAKVYIPVVPGLKDKGILAGNFDRDNLESIRTDSYFYLEVEGERYKELQKRIQRRGFIQKFEVGEERLKSLMKNGKLLGKSDGSYYTDLCCIIEHCLKK